MKWIDVIGVEHTQPLIGGELQWPDDRYRDLLLAAPRSVWTVDAIRIAARTADIPSGLWFPRPVIKSTSLARAICRSRSHASAR